MIGQLRLSDELAVSRLIQGTMAVDQLDERDAFRLFDAVVEMGCTTFDTAHVYGGGENERIFGRWLVQRGGANDLVVIGKGCEPGPDGPRVTPEHLDHDLHESLDRMGLDTIDLFLIHVDDPQVPVEPLIDALAQHCSSGMIRAYGVSNWHHERVAAAQDHARAAGHPPLVASSVHLSLAPWREQPWPGNISIAGREHTGAREWYHAAGLPVLAWSSLAGGFFSGRISRQQRAEGYFDQVCLRAYGSDENFDRLERAQVLARRYGASPAQVALAWLFAGRLPVAALVGSLAEAEFRADVEALTLAIDAEDLRWLDDAMD